MCHGKHSYTKRVTNIDQQIFIMQSCWKTKKEKNQELDKKTFSLRLYKLIHIKHFNLPPSPFSAISLPPPPPRQVCSPPCSRLIDESGAAQPADCVVNAELGTGRQRCQTNVAGVRRAAHLAHKLT